MRGHKQYCNKCKCYNFMYFNAAVGTHCCAVCQSKCPSPWDGDNTEKRVSKNNPLVLISRPRGDKS